MSGIMEVKNDRTNVRRKAAMSFTFTRCASGTTSDDSATCSSAVDSTATGGSASSEGDSCVEVELFSAVFAPSVVSVSALAAAAAVAVETVVLGCGVAGACALAAGSAAAGARGALARRPATFGRMP